MHHDNLLPTSDTLGYFFHKSRSDDTCSPTNFHNKRHSKAPFFLHRMQTGKGQSQRFIPTIHTVECLYCVTRGTFHEIIKSSNNDHPLLMGIKLEADIAIITARQNLRLRIAVDTIALFDQSNERLMLVSLTIESP